MISRCTCVPTVRRPTGAQRFVELGLNPDQVVLVVLAEGLSHAAEAALHRAGGHYAAGMSWTSIRSQALVEPDRAASLDDPAWRAVHAAAAHDGDGGRQRAGERAAGKSLPGARQVTVAFADLVGSPSQAKWCRPKS